ncbi:hypothetical protein ACFSTC_15060 [Nonomuraea ferruginea]
MVQCLAAQVAMVPESQVRIASPVAARSTQLIRYCGAIGERRGDSSARMSARQAFISSVYLAR